MVNSLLNTVLYCLSMGRVNGDALGMTPRAAHEDRNGWICLL